MPEAETFDLNRLGNLIRTELKLDPSSVIDAETKLVGGDHDLDSLDILMLVTAIEKECGVKIPDESIGREVFESVGTLHRFIVGRGA